MKHLNHHLTLQKMSPITVYRSPALYDANNLPMLRDAKLSLNKYFHLLRWKQGERIVDIGCGTGNVMTQILEPRLPADYKLLVGFDISEHNVKYAAEQYSAPRITYLQGDIIEPDYERMKGFFEKNNISIGFDKVFSLHCLHWVKNSELWSKNIYSMLKPGGQIFLQFFTYNGLVDMWIEVAFSERWNSYTKVVGPHRTEFHYSTDLNGDLTKLMSDAGFIVESCEHFTVYYDTQWPDDKMMTLMRSGDPYVQAIPEELYSDYFKDLYSFYKKYQYEKYAKTGTPYTFAVIVASKPSD